MIAILVFGFIVLSAICLWLLIEGRKSPKFLIWFIPALLILISSTYVTYTSILGFPKIEIPKKGLYLKHYIDEPYWIYLWVVEEGNVPRSYQMHYKKVTHQSLEGVQEKAEEGKYMVLGGDDLGDKGDGNDEDEGGERGGGFTIGGDISFYEWDYLSEMPPKNAEE